MFRPPLLSSRHCRTLSVYVTNLFFLRPASLCSVTFFVHSILFSCWPPFARVERVPFFFFCSKCRRPSPLGLDRRSSTLPAPAKPVGFIFFLPLLPTIDAPPAAVRGRPFFFFSFFFSFVEDDGRSVLGKFSQVSPRRQPLFFGTLFGRRSSFQRKGESLPELRLLSSFVSVLPSTATSRGLFPLRDGVSSFPYCPDSSHRECAVSPPCAPRSAYRSGLDALGPS